MINFFSSHISPKAIENVERVLLSGMLSEGEWVDKFEEELKRRFGIHHLVTVNSGTSALILALILADVGEGDEVILSPQTFIASGLSILNVGAIPVFVDIDSTTGNINPLYIEKAITPKTKAILVVHWGGLVADLEEIHLIADKHGLKVVEDAAHALGAKYKGIPIGNYSHFTCFSFQSIKNLTTGDGGAIAFQNPIHEKRAKKLRWFGIDRERDLPNELGERQYQLTEIGQKFHMNNIAAAIGLGNLDGWTTWAKRKEQIRGWYNSELKNISGLEIIEKTDYEYRHGNWLYTILVEPRSKFIQKMKLKNIPVSVVHQGIIKQPIFKTNPEHFHHQRFWDVRQISLPFHANLKDEEIRQIISAIQGGW